MSFSINVIPILCTKDSRLGVFVAFSHFLFAISAFICLYALVFVDMWICGCVWPLALGPKIECNPSGQSNPALSNLPWQPLLNYASSSVSLNTLLCTLTPPKQSANTHTCNGFVYCSSGKSWPTTSQQLLLPAGLTT